MRHQVGRRPAPIQRHGGQGGELPTGRVPCLRQPAPACAARPAAVPCPRAVGTWVAGWARAWWQGLVVGQGSKGPGVQDWAAARVIASRDQWPGRALWLLARRSPADPTDLAYYLASAPADTPLVDLARV